MIFPQVGDIQSSVATSDDGRVQFRIIITFLKKILAYVISFVRVKKYFAVVCNNRKAVTHREDRVHQ